MANNITTIIYDDHTSTYRNDELISTHYTEDKRSKPYSIFTEDGKRFGNSKFFGGAISLTLGWILVFLVMFSLANPEAIHPYTWLQSALESISSSPLNNSATKLMDALRSFSNLQNFSVSDLGKIFMIPIYLVGCLLSVFDTLFRLVFTLG